LAVSLFFSLGLLIIYVFSLESSVVGCTFSWKSRDVYLDVDPGVLNYFWRCSLSACSNASKRSLFWRSMLRSLELGLPVPLWELWP